MPLTKETDALQVICALLVDTSSRTLI